MMHFLVRFQPLPGKEAAFREALRRVVEASRQEPGCAGIEPFESLREPVEFAIHSRWTDEAAFELHATMPHTVRFLDETAALLAHPIQGQRLRSVDHALPDATASRK